MGTFPESAWVSAFQERVNSDPELALTGKKFTADIGVAFGDVRYVLNVRRGKLESFLSSPGFDVPTNFGMRAPISVWRKFLADNPPPLFHDFFAMLMRVPEFVIDGNTLQAMQSARALHRMMNLMQETGK
ncbi:hypothetical protein AC629_19280 [Bradyrhizobium sp. NAS80.1]|uniref:hypothetical protein n=1 Tax=Bradyrhizobium sp. NAS80.1 TaxID=1680159 RepID=UPI000960DE4C|nr:hypothetical protein [Bradyrhizobium sp. NAS80.1]OKO85364.1 hypothetical protein AC629_19280 [Bradyrhizobium sp. NAS80.1]